MRTALTKRGTTLSSGSAFLEANTDRPVPVFGAPHEWSVDVRFAGARRAEGPVGVDPTPTRMSFFSGPARDWVTNVMTYSGVAYPDLWPGVDALVSGAATGLKYRFDVGPGADPSVINLAYRGVTSARIRPDGSLELRTPAGILVDQPPVAHQTVGGSPRYVAAAYTEPRGHGRTWRVGFDLGPYDPRRPLVIDPLVVASAGFIGGSEAERCRGVAVAPDGSVYVVGTTYSSPATFPVQNGFDDTFDVAPDAFVAKLAPSGDSYEYVSYLGGESWDIGMAVDVDGAGNAYVTGATKSTRTFPLKVGPARPTSQRFNAFITKLNAAGTEIIFSGVIGGDAYDLAESVAVDETGAVYLAGQTNSSDGSFPAVVGPDLTYGGGRYDGWTAKVRPDGTGLEYAGFVGGGERDTLRDIAIDDLGNAYVIGETFSSEDTLPVRVGPDTTYGGNQDAFVAKVNTSGTDFEYLGYVGGRGREGPETAAGYFGIAVGETGSAYVTGATTSGPNSFPVTVGPSLVPAGGGDAFVAKLNPAGTGFEFAGYVGGAGGETSSDIVLDDDGGAYLVGSTSSTEATFPVTGGPDLTWNGGDDTPFDAFLAHVAPSGNGLLSLGYIGGAGDDEARGVDRAGDGTIYVVGETDSTEETFPALGGPDVTANGGVDGFIAKVIEVYPELSVSASGDAGPAEVGDELTYSITVANQGGIDAADVALWVRLPSSATVDDIEASSGTCTDPVDEEGAVSCALGTVAAGSSVEVSLSVIPLEPGTMTVEAEVSPAQGEPDLSNNAAAVDTSVEGVACTIVGTAGADTLTGSDQVNDVICGLSGGDVLRGVNGADILYGGPDEDRAYGGRGSDTVSGQTGDDIADGGADHDLVIGGSGADGIFGGNGNDTARGEDGTSGNDYLDGGAGVDTCTADPGDTVLACP